MRVVWVAARGNSKEITMGISIMCRTVCRTKLIFSTISAVMWH